MTPQGRRQWLSALAATAVLAPAPSAWAAGGRVALRWSAPEGCPEAARVIGEVDRLLGDRSPIPDKPLEVAATVAEADGGFKVRLETPGEGGARVREIKGASCLGIADATALIIALMIDPAAVSRAAPAPAPPASPPPPPTPPPPTPPPAPPNPSPAPLPPPAEAPRPASPPLRPSYRLLAWALADAGSLPGVSLAVGGKAAVVLGALRLELGAGVWPDRSSPLPRRPSAGGRVGLVAGSAGACWSFLGPGRFELGPCLSYEIGRLHADGYGITTPGSGAALWSALEGGGLFAWAPAEHVAIDFRLDAAVPFARPTFVLEGLGSVYRSSPVDGRATTGVEVRF